MNHQLARAYRVIGTLQMRLLILQMIKEMREEQ